MSKDTPVKPVAPIAPDAPVAPGVPLAPTPLAAPLAPDAMATAGMQGGLNQNTATTQQLLNMTDQVTPNGTLRYDQTGTSTFTGPDGKTYSVPKFRATTTLSPEQQQLLSLTNKTKTNLGQVGFDQSHRIGDLLGTDLNLDTATEGKIDKLGAARLDPQFAKGEDALRTRLANQGIQPGSAAWNAEMTQFQQGKNDAYNQLYLTGRGQGAQEALTERNQPINEIGALMSGSQVSNPTFSSTPTTSVGGVDFGGMVNNNFSGENSQYATGTNSQNSLYSTFLNGINSQYATTTGGTNSKYATDVSAYDSANRAYTAQRNAELGGMFGLAGTLGAGVMKNGFNPMAWGT